MLHVKKWELLIIIFAKYEYVIGIEQWLFHSTHYFVLLINDVYLPELLPNPEHAKYLLYDNLILGKECDPIPPPPPSPFSYFPDDAGMRLL
jgi:hypothetical protein